METSSEIQGIVLGWFRAVESGDTSFIDRHFSTDAHARLVGTDPNEWLLGADVAEFMRREIVVMGEAGLAISPGEPEAFREGDVGWALARPSITTPDGAAVSVRWNAVLRRTDGEWKFVLIHASIGVPTESLGELSKVWQTFPGGGK